MIVFHDSCCRETYSRDTHHVIISTFVIERSHYNECMILDSTIQRVGNGFFWV